MRRMLTVPLAALCFAGLPAIAAAGAPVATTDGEAAGLSLQVSDLKVSNGTVMLKFTIVNDSSQPFDTESMNDTTVGTPDYHSISGVYLRWTAKIAPKSSPNLWAKFPAPPDSVKKVGIAIPHFVPLDDVPLSR